VRNGHTKLSMVFTKLIGIIPTLVCQNPFYKTSSIFPFLISQQCCLVVSWAC
jgi:hypothetical protein